MPPEGRSVGQAAEVEHAHRTVLELNEPVLPVLGVARLASVGMGLHRELLTHADDAGCLHIEADVTADQADAMIPVAVEVIIRGQHLPEHSLEDERALDALAGSAVVVLADLQLYVVLLRCGDHLVRPSQVRIDGRFSAVADAHLRERDAGLVIAVRVDHHRCDLRVGRLDHRGHVCEVRRAVLAGALLRLCRVHVTNRDKLQVLVHLGDDRQVRARSSSPCAYESYLDSVHRQQLLANARSVAQARSERSTSCSSWGEQTSPGSRGDSNAAPT